jgi:hypothetical protein
VPSSPLSRWRKRARPVPRSKRGEGRGFLVEGKHHLGFTQRYVITAAHCPPHLPPATPWSYIEERTYENFVGLLGEAPTLWAECCFADRVGDIAVLVEPDSNSLPDLNEAWLTTLNDLPGLSRR